MKLGHPNHSSVKLIFCKILYIILFNLLLQAAEVLMDTTERQLEEIEDQMQAWSRVIIMFTFLPCQTFE